MSELADVMPAIEASNEYWADARRSAKRGPFDDFPDSWPAIIEWMRVRRRPLMSVVTLPRQEVRLCCDLCGGRLVLPWEDRGDAEPRLQQHVHEVCPWTKDDTGS